MKYTKQNRNSYGQFLRSRERMFWTSAYIIPSRKHTNPKTKIVTILPATVSKPGYTYTKPLG